MRPHGEVPAGDVAAEGRADAPRAEAAHRDPGPLAVVEHRPVDPRPADVGAGEAHRPPPGDGGDRRSTGRVDLRGAGHLSTPVTTTPRMNARWASRKTTIGTAIVMSD